ncbi:RusA family crossover junction endodeoxyribonuclease [Nannocystis sp. ILAH1]|uniref:RusA family crossover junction endodeoxyribonuclease n=1 Tax=Nannocystis sp. ILAH1 TaxID=2996789 RepID=UPI00226EA05B|nr:RusA family crossover junction endodeoxyribonuclease [Nannocystis sp. ILAH1]MCY0990641.1 RusA family crossover junction endodeoxyribonuclease [Nannocystis sp. ILAH1]
MDRFVFLIPCRPPTKNRSHRAVNGKIILSADTRAFRASVAQIAAAKKWPQIKEGRWSMLVITTAPQLRHLGEEHIPYLDSDAVLAEVRDALQEAGVLDDDLRVVSTTGEVVYRPGEEPHCLVELTRLEKVDITHTYRVYESLLVEAKGERN